MMLASRPVGGDKLIAGPFSQVLGSSERPRWPELSVLLPDRVRCSTPLSQNTPQHRTPTPQSQEWAGDRLPQRRMAGSGGALLANSVTSPTSSGNSHDALVHMVVKTIDDQENRIQRLRVQVMKALDKLTEKQRKEAEIRAFLEQCQVKSHELKGENAKLREQNSALRQQLAELKQRDIDSPDCPHVGQLEVLDTT